ncbi:MAG: DNA-protecting protein DprA, partial [Hyphomicrobiaceae bacterium]
MNLFAAAPLPVAPLDNAQRLACLRLIRSDNVGPVAFRELINLYGGAEAALAALPELARRGGGSRQPRVTSRQDGERELERAGRAGAVPGVTIEPGDPRARARL